MRLFFYFFVIAFSFIGNLVAEERLFLSPQGQDSNLGSKDKPLATLEGVRDRIRKMRKEKSFTDTLFVEIQSGTYYITHAFQLTEDDSGTLSAPIVFLGDKNNKPIVCGGRKTVRFEEVTDSLWRAFIPEVADLGFYFEQLYINGERRFRAQTPNRGTFMFPKRVEETVLDSLSGKPAFASQKLVVKTEDYSILNTIRQSDLNDVLIVANHKWDNSRKRIQYINALDSFIFFGGSVMPFWNMIDGKSRYVIENYRNALEQPGEWFLQRDGYLYYMPLQGETIENTECMYPVSEKLLCITGSEGKQVSSIRFENICFEGAAYCTPPSGNDPSQAAAIVDAAIMLDNARNIEFVNCDIAHIGQHAIWFRKNCSYSRVEHCHLYDLGGGGVKIGDYTLSQIDQDGFAATHHITIHNNIIQHGGYIFPNAVGVIIFHGSDNEITHNDIADFRYTGVSVGWVWGYAPSPSKRNKIEFNHIHHLGWGELCDMGGVYTLGASEGTIVSNNIIHDIYSFFYGGWGLYTDEGSYGIRMENNLVYCCKNAGFHQHYGKDNIIRNNIFAFNKLSQLQLTKVEDHLSFSFVNNIIYFEEGLLYMDMIKGAWLNAQTVIDSNCFWDVRTINPNFLGYNFNEWKRLGKDKHSIVADPAFVNPKGFDFRFRNMDVVKKIGFKPFDYSRAGVYGDLDWKTKAILSDHLIKQFTELSNVD
ncbi:right-handed parallel beta-helix repeat-containing protein [Parabacteroides distasonis]|jgi:hypothetical protein|uniref:right-handed parallel beta-helix repeat-containing protein n=1 Tax=Parabacteroides distasonis TaxID=823 RepID=UPI0012B16DA2|nr:right-handed parallel beta-helix repeat-containing protein [Parabacteroides distasonis]MRY74768.1 right-handed parallel beta-helix repeat-containing protein [Parabacteroides distasonis]UBD78989.1 right-handed parallel beta-helix repeat-containing protein [Parabacteroides distasonis]